jgi:hypothetical protein
MDIRKNIKEIKMPNMDGTEPAGAGAKIGRQLGNCEGVRPIGCRRNSCGEGLRKGFRKGCFTRSVKFSEDKKRILEAKKSKL